MRHFKPAYVGKKNDRMTIYVAGMPITITLGEKRLSGLKFWVPVRDYYKFSGRLAAYRRRCRAYVLVRLATPRQRARHGIVWRVAKPRVGAKG